MEDFFSHYLSYTSNSEVPATFHRWSAIAGIGALLGRRYNLQHGHFNIHPNTYCMLIGSSGTRKSSAVKLMKRLIKEIGYDTIAADKSTKEKFLLDLAGDTSGDGVKPVKDFLEANLWGDDYATKPDAEMFVMADEFNDFFGNGNIEFFSLLGTLWDYEGVYSNRIKNGTSVSINNPTVSILGGNTPTGFSLAFPTEVLGQGFFSRILLIYGEPNGTKIAFPEPPPPEQTTEILRRLGEIKCASYGTPAIHGLPKTLLEKIYRTYRGIDDVRFESYSTRRFTHLLKLCLIHSAARGGKAINERDIIHANTVLTHAEHLMPKALGEFGKARHSAVSQKIITLIDAAKAPVPFKEIWSHVSSDLDKLTDLAELLKNLQAADKIQSIADLGFLPKKKVIEDQDTDLVDYSYLTDQEKRISI